MSPASRRRPPGRKARPEAAGLALPLWKRALFIGLPLVASLLLLEAVAALLGFEPARGGDPFVGFASRTRAYAPAPDASGALALETAPERRRWMHATRFTAHKQHGQYRVFALGGSTTYGRPYDADDVSFPGWLRALLPAAEPSRSWEIINAGGISYASYRVALLMEELVDYEPDLFLVYTGHNEFLERRTYSGLLSAPPFVLDAIGALRRTHGWALLSAALLPGAKPDQVLADEPAAILDDSIGPAAYSRDDAWADDVRAHLRFNLERMVDLAEAAGARIVFVTPASNLAAFSPFRSQAGDALSPPALDEIAALEARADAAEADGDAAAALAALERALALDPRNAEHWYRRGQLLLSLGRVADAAAALVRARDEDVCPLRAPSPIVESVRAVAHERGVPLLDFEARVGTLSPDGIPGAGQFLDHVHPDARTYGVLAEWIVDELARVGIVARRPDWSAPGFARLREEVMSRIDRDAEAAALRNLAKVLGWAGQLDEVQALLDGALARNPDDLEALINLGTLQLRNGDPAAAAETLARAVEVAPEDLDTRDFHADALLRAGRTQEALAAYRALLALDEASVWTHNNLAWILATTEDAQLRDAGAAREHAERAVALNGAPDAMLLDTLAAAHAAAGDRAAALEAIDRAIALARAVQDTEQLAGLLRNRALYAEGRLPPSVE